MAGRLGCLVIIPFRALGVENEVRAPCGKGASPDPRSPWTCLLLLIPRPSTPGVSLTNLALIVQVKLHVLLWKSQSKNWH